MKLYFTHHARSQTLARNINESRIAGTPRNPNTSDPAAAGAIFFRKKFEDGILEVICKRIGKNKNEYLVLTAYFI